MSHIIGKVYDLTKENFNKIIAELEATQAALQDARILARAFEEGYEEREEAFREVSAENTRLRRELADRALDEIAGLTEELETVKKEGGT